MFREKYAYFNVFLLWVYTYGTTVRQNGLVTACATVSAKMLTTLHKPTQRTTSTTNSLPQSVQNGHAHVM